MITLGLPHLEPLHHHLLHNVKLLYRLQTLHELYLLPYLDHLYQVA